MASFAYCATMIRPFQGITPTVPESCFIEDTGIVIGDVVMGEQCSVWFHAVIRGDVNYIRIGNRTNVQDLCMLHVTHDTYPLVIGNDVTISGFKGCLSVGDHSEVRQP